MREGFCLRLPVPAARVAPEIPSVITCSDSESRIFIPVEITLQSENVGTKALVDSGAEGLFIDHKFVEKHGIQTNPVRQAIQAQNVDGTMNNCGLITREATLDFVIGHQEQRETFLVTSLGSHDLILGHPWLERQNPVIDWQQRIIELSAMSHISKATELAQAHYQKDTRPLEEQVPSYLHPYLDVFSEEKAKEFPPSRSYDHQIELKEGFVPKIAKVLPMAPKQEQMLNEFLDKNLAKGYIKLSTSDQELRFFHFSHYYIISTLSNPCVPFIT